MAGLIFAVSKDAGGGLSIASYCFDGETEGLAILKPYTLETAKSMAFKKKIIPWRRLTYKEMVAAVRRVLPMAWVPTRDELWAEYGLDAGKEAC